MSLAPIERMDICQKTGFQKSLNGTRVPQSAIRVLSALEDAGLEAWLVGGWVRDALMGVPSHDVDMCCSGTWRQSEHALASAGISVVESGIKFGGITAVADGERIEVTTYRIDGFYTDGRHPEDVSRATCVEDDLARRDFTVNAMAWHPVRGLLDLYGGQQDIARSVIKAVGEPARRFREDALRMLRAVRFACRLDFSIEAATAHALADCAPLLDAVARERVGIELTGILKTGRAGDALMRYPELMCSALPELSACRGFYQQDACHDSDIYEHLARVVSAVCGMEPRPHLATVWAALLHDVAKPHCFSSDEAGHGRCCGHPEASERMARGVFKRLSISGDVAREACLLIRHQDMSIGTTREDILRALNRLSQGGGDALERMDALLDIKRADALGKMRDCGGYLEACDKTQAYAHDLVDAGEAFSVQTLDLTGRDLIESGVEPGPQIGRMLQSALSGTMDGKVPNERAELLRFIDLS